MIFFAWVGATLAIDFVASDYTASTLERFGQSLGFARVHCAHEATCGHHQVATFCRLLVHLSHGERPRDNLVEVAAQLVKVLRNLTKLAERLSKLSPQRLFRAVFDAGAKACRLHLELGLLLLLFKLGSPSLPKTLGMLSTRHLLILLINLLYQS